MTSSSSYTPSAETWVGIRVRVMAELVWEEFKRRRDPFWRYVVRARIREVLWWVRRVPQLRPAALAAFRYGKGRNAA